jgi:hypothetical protein
MIPHFVVDVLLRAACRVSVTQNRKKETERHAGTIAVERKDIEFTCLSICKYLVPIISSFSSHDFFFTLVEHLEPVA